MRQSTTSSPSVRERYSGRGIGLLALTSIMILVGLGQHARAQTEIDPVLAARLQTIIEQQRLMSDMPGVSAAVIAPGGKTWRGVDGVSHATTSIADGMLFGVGSITKTFTAAVIMKLAEEGKVAITDSLHTWLPSYQYVDSTITIRQLLSHTSGLYDYLKSSEWNAALVADPTQPWPPEEIVSRFLGPPSFAPGKGWQYSNTNYTLLGMIIEKATGRTLAEEYRSRLFTPVGLQHTYLEAAEEFDEDIVHPWSDLNGDGVTDDAFFFPRQGLYSTAWGAGAIFSAPEELTRWAKALYGGHLLNDSSLAQMLTFRSVNLGSADGYGLGVMRYRFSGRTVYGHNGNIMGYSSTMLYDPKDSISIALIFNGNVDAGPAGLALIQAVMNYVPSGVDNSANITGNATLNIHHEASGQRVGIQYTLPERGIATLHLYDAFGREIATPVQEEKEAGTYNAIFDAAGLPHGLYLFRLQIGKALVTKKIGL